MKRRIVSALAIAILLAAGIAGTFTVTPAAKIGLNFTKIEYNYSNPG